MILGDDPVALAQLEAMINSRAWGMLKQHIERQAAEKVWAVAKGATRSHDRDVLIRLIQAECYRDAPLTIQDAIREMKIQLQEENKS
jgi:hypothetical protein